MIEFVKRNAQGCRLFLIAFAILYLELALIRFTSAEAIYLGYFSNFILNSVFLGIGVGFLLAEREVRLLRMTPQLVLLFVAFTVVTHIDASYLREHIGQLYFGNDSSTLVVPLWLSLGLLFVLSAAIFAGLAQEAALCFAHFKPLTAYSIDIAGSLAGIAVFTLHSFLGVTPVEWFAVVLIVVAVLSFRYSLLNAAVIGLGVVLVVFASAPTHYTSWSPYQRIEVWPQKPGRKDGYHLAANGIGHQTMQKVGTKEPIYDFPYLELAKFRGRGFDDVLIIGSGSGTDVSYALHYGAKHVDGVEIDPSIYEAGVLFHPERPYQDPRVHVTINDGRAYMQRCDKRYDLVIFALPDSLATLSNFANVRLESFLFTVESFQQARRLLKPDGVLVLYNYYRKAWLMQKLAGMLAQAFGHPPAMRVYSTESGGMLGALAIGPRTGGAPLTVTPIPPATDNWPFLYMQTPQLSGMYVWIMLLFVGSALLAVFLSGHGALRDARSDGAFALMGAAFLLLETKSVIQFLLLFGATWLVNSLVFFAILLLVLLANLVVQRFDVNRPGLLFALLLGALVLQYLIPPERLLGIESGALRYLVATLLLLSPIFFGNLVFGFLFKDTPKASSAFGWNIIGTMIGGALEYSSIAVGYRSLTLVVIALYTACFFWTRWTLRGRAAPAGA